MKILRLVLLITVPVLFLAGCKMGIDKSFRIGDDTKSYGSVNTIDGNIHVGENSEVTGECRTIDGWIDIGKNSRVKGLKAIDGNIRVRKNAVVRGDIGVIDGEVRCETGVKVNGYIGTISGDIKLEGTFVEDNLSTYDGNFKLYENTNVRGDILIKNRHGDTHFQELYIEIDNSIVDGNIINEDFDTDLTVYLSNGGQVKGQIKNALLVNR